MKGGTIVADLITAMGSAFTNISDNIMDVFAVVVPAVLAVIGVGLAIRIGIKYFKNLSKSA